MVPKAAPKAALAVSLFQVSKKGATAFHNFAGLRATWAILGANLAPAGRQLDPQIEHFGSKLLQNGPKLRPE